MGWRPPRSTRTDPLVPYTTGFRYDAAQRQRLERRAAQQDDGNRRGDDADGPTGCGKEGIGGPHGDSQDQELRAVPDAADEEAERAGQKGRSEEHTSELQSLMSISYAVFWLQKKNTAYYLHTD